MIVTEENMDRATPVFDTMGPLPTYTTPTAKPLTSALKRRITKDQDQIFAAVAAQLEAERLAAVAEPLISLTSAYRIVSSFGDGRMTVPCPVCGEVFKPQTAAGDIATVTHSEDGTHTIGYTKKPCPHHNVVARWGATEGMCTNCGHMVPRDPEQGDGSRDVIDTQHGKIFAADGDREAIEKKWRDQLTRTDIPVFHECEGPACDIHGHEGFNPSMPDVVHALQVWTASTIKTPENRGAEPIDYPEVSGGGVPYPRMPSRDDTRLDITLLSLADPPPVARPAISVPWQRLGRKKLVERIAREQAERNTAEIQKVVD